MKRKILFWCAASIFITSINSCKKDEVLSVTQNTGGYAQEYAKSDKYQSLSIEVIYMTGFKPEEAALNNLKHGLISLLNKPQGIEFTYKEIAAQGKASYSLDDVKAIEIKNRTGGSIVGELYTSVLVLDGEYSTKNIIGIAYAANSICLFGSVIKAYSGGLLKPSKANLESTVLQHEFGHLLGLVDNGSPMVVDHKDKDHPQHCNNTKCLMYYSTETSTVADIMMGGTVFSLDENCKNDLRANGGK